MDSNSCRNFTVQTLTKKDGKDQDPDYNEAAAPDRKRLKHLEENAKSRLGERVKHILTNHFELEGSRQHAEIIQIDKSISRVQQKLQILRYIANRSFFSPKTLQISGMPTASQTAIHPTVKNMLGKRPTKMLFECSSVSTVVEQAEEVTTNHTDLPIGEHIKVPRYIPPKLPERIVATPVRGELHCMKKKLIIGNISRWIPVSERDDTASHKWMVYVRGPKEEPNVSSFISQVIFFLHPSYAPHDTIHVLCHPFHVTRRGWGEFPLRIQVHFHNPLCKPVNIIHNLKLDRSYTGLQTLGAETIVDVMVFDTKIDRSCFSAVNEAPSQQEKEESTSKSDDNISNLVSEVDEEGLTLQGHYSNAEIGCPQCSDAASPQTSPCDHQSEGSTRNSIECSEEENGCALVKSIVISKIDIITDIVQNKPFEIETSQPLDYKIVDRDHDYFLTGDRMHEENETPLRDRSSPLLLKPERKAEEFSEQFLNLASTSCVTMQSGKLPAPHDAVLKPVLVRCFNKNGKTFKLPLALLRNAIIVQPHRLAKAGESLLRSPISSLPIISDLPADIVQPLPGKVLSSSSRPQIITKLDPSRRDRIGLEAKFINERKICDAFFDQICNSTWTTIRDCVRVLARNLCLISPKAEDPVYRSLHPYSSPTLETFVSWNIGKRRSAEWTRAKLIRRTLLKCSFASGEATWTTKAIMNWCRRQGYSPMCCWLHTSSTSTKCEMSILPQEIITLTKIEFDSARMSPEDEIPVEVESLIELDCTLPATTQSPKASFLVNDPDPRLTSWIVDSIEKHGFKFGSDVCENFLIPLSRVLLSHIWREIAEDLLRRSLSQSWQRNRGAIPDEISLIDTYGAISHRPQFDIVTNAGMAKMNHNDHDPNLAN